MSAFDKITAQEVQTAQTRLNELCDKYKIERFEIKHTGHKSRKWQALVLRMCGLDIGEATRGRTPDKTLEEAGMVAWLDQDLRGIKPKESTNEIIRTFNLKPKKSGYGVEADLHETVRTARKRVKKKIEKIALETKNKQANPDIDKMME